MPKLKKTTYFSYSMPAFVLAFAALPLYVIAPDFYATEMGVPLGILGAVLLAVRAFDAVQDPLIGYVSDRFSRYRSGLFIFAFVAFAAGMLLLYMPAKSFALYSFAFGMVLSATAFSVISINLNAIGSLLARDTHAKTDIAAWREGFGVAGILLATVMPFVLMNFFAIRSAFALYAIFFAICVLIAACFFLPWLTHRSGLVLPSSTAKSQKVRIDFSFLKDFALRFFFMTYAVSVFASALPAVLVIFFIRDVLDAENMTGVFLLVYFLSAMAAIPLWRMASLHIGKVQSWVIAIILAVATFVWAGFLSAGDTLFYAAICALAGAALGAELILPPSILSDLIDARDAHETTSMQFSILAFFMKAALALAAGISFYLLDEANFRAGEENSDTALCMLVILYAFIPCALKLVSAAMLWAWAKWLQKGKMENEKNNRIYSNGGHYDIGGV
ncbi:MAG TPA: MFS transporter [Alphaproteobacteria bacterium]|nr:MFS transporter [Alphaproteobacteria bacterium]